GDRVVEGEGALGGEDLARDRRRLIVGTGRDLALEVLAEAAGVRVALARGEVEFDAGGGAGLALAGGAGAAALPRGGDRGRGQAGGGGAPRSAAGRDQGGPEQRAGAGVHTRGLHIGRVERAPADAWTPARDRR